jgi:hypothetical protein
MSDRGHGVLDKDDVKGCFTGSMLVGCFTIGLMVLLTMAVFLYGMSLAVSQDPGHRNGGRNLTDNPTSEINP